MSLSRRTAELPELRLAAPGPPWDEVVVVCGPPPHGWRPTAAEQLARGLADHVPVVAVERRRGRADDGADASRRTRLVAPRLARVVVERDPRSVAASHPAGRAWRELRAALEDLGSPRVRALVVTAPEPWFGAAAEERRVFYAGADLLGAVGPDGPARRWERSLRRLLDATDIVIASSPLIGAMVSAPGRSATIVPPGADDRITAAVGPAPRRPGLGGSGTDSLPAGLRAGYLGDLTGDVDLDALHSVAAAGIATGLVGAAPPHGLGTDARRLLARPEVSWTGPRPVGQVRLLADRIRVGLVPLVDTPFTQARLALDAVAHLAHGHPVVGTDCETSRWLRTEGAAAGLDPDRDVVLVADPSTMGEAVRHVLSAPEDLAARSRRRAFAARHTWTARGAEVAAVLGVRPAPTEVHPFVLAETGA